MVDVWLVFSSTYSNWGHPLFKFFFILRGAANYRGVRADICPLVHFLKKFERVLYRRARPPLRAQMQDGAQSQTIKKFEYRGPLIGISYLVGDRPSILGDALRWRSHPKGERGRAPPLFASFFLSGCARIRAHLFFASSSISKRPEKKI